MNNNDVESLIDFLLYGRLGQLHAAMTEKQVHQLLGEPEISRKTTLPDVVDSRYGNLNIVFDTGNILFISIDFREARSGIPEILAIEWLETVQAMNLATFRQFLRTNQIPYYKADLPDYFTNTILVMNSGTEVLFDSGEQLQAIAFDTEGSSHRPLIKDVY